MVKLLERRLDRLIDNRLQKGWMDILMVGQMDRQIVERRDGWIDRYIWIDRLQEGQIEDWLDLQIEEGEIVGQMNGQMVGYMDR